MKQFHAEYDDMVAGSEKRSDDVKDWEKKKWVDFHQIYAHEMKEDPVGTKSWKNVSNLLIINFQMLI